MHVWTVILWMVAIASIEMNVGVFMKKNISRFVSLVIVSYFLIPAHERTEYLIMCNNDFICN